MRHLKIAFFIILSIILFSPFTTMAQFAIDAQLRNRFEIRDGYQKLATRGSTPAVIISQRTRLGLSYRTENIQFKFTPQDVRLWGDENLISSTGVFGDYASLAMFEGYASIKLGEWGWLSTGRQPLVYDSKRILGNRNWNQNGIAYDAVVLKLKLNLIDLHVGGVWNTLEVSNTDNPYPSDRMKSLDYLWVNRVVNENLSFSLLHISSGVTETDTSNTIRFRQTTGIYTEYNNDKLNFWGNVYYQYGKNREGSGVSAWLVDADAAYTISDLVCGTGMGFLSGNDRIKPDLETDHAFDVLYGNRHKYFGFMDYFRNNSSHTKQGGLLDYYIYLDYQFSKILNIRNIGHYFQLARINPSTPASKPLGYENNLILSCKFSDWGVLETGYLFFLPTAALETIQDISNSRYSQFFYLQLTVNPTIYIQQP